MPINPYQNQVQTMQAQGIPDFNAPPPQAPPPAPPAAQPPVAQPPVGQPPIAQPAPVPPERTNHIRDIMGAIFKNPNFDRTAFRGAMQDWRGGRPIPGAPGSEGAMDPAAFRAAMQTWRGGRPQRSAFPMPAPAASAPAGLVAGVPVPPGANG